MPLTKQYLRYSPSGCFNIISSPRCNNAWISLKGQDGRFVAAGACDNVIVWDFQLGEKAMAFVAEKTVVTTLSPCPLNRYLAAGFRDGNVKTYDLNTGETSAVFSGHKSAITSLSYGEDGHRLASGSKDTHIVLWDVVSESGIARLSSHTGPITRVMFIKHINVLVSSSEDTSVKFWDLDTNHCFKTLLGHKTEVWDFGLLGNGKYLATGCGDSELRVWSVNDLRGDAANLKASEDDEEDLSILQLKKLGSILRSSTKRAVGISVEKEGRVLGVHGVENSFELFQFCSDQDAMLRFKKRKKKERKKSESNIVPAENESPTLQDIVKRLPVIKTVSKIKSGDIIMGTNDEIRVALNLSNNSLELYSVTNSGDVNRIRIISHQGHRSDVRALAWSSDGLAVASGGGDSVKLWNKASLSCLRSIPVTQIISLVFAPGDRHLLAGTKDGHLLILDVSVGEVLEDIPAHTTELWSLAILPNQRGCVSAGGDKSVKFWDFELVSDSRASESAKILSLLHKRTLTLDEPVLCVRITPDSKLIAVSLLDMTIKVFFMDTLKFFLSLYGHKLPVLSMDISHDSSLLVSASADRNIKLWGLDFGDCHKSIFAHESAVTCVQFIPETHQFFSSGKDGRIKQWDADNFQNIINLQGHFGEAWAVAISPNGSHVVSTGSDRVLRLVDKTEEPLVLGDVDEDELEEQLITGNESTVKGQGDLQLPTRKTYSSELGAEQLMECLEECRTYQSELDDYRRGNSKGPAPQRPPLMLAYNAVTIQDFLINTIRRIRSSELEEALLLLPFTSACELLRLLPSLLSMDHEVELVVRTLLFLIKVHHGPIVSSKDLLPVLGELQQLAVQRIVELRDMVGRNLFGLHLLQRNIEQREGIQLFKEATEERKSKSKKKKRKAEAMKRSLLLI